MSINLSINGNNYAFPEPRDPAGWGQPLLDWATAVTNGMLQKAGGSFILLSELDFGATYGLKSVYLKSRTANPASFGNIRLAKTDSIAFRNNDNNADLALSIDASNNLLWNGSAIQQTALTFNDTDTIDFTNTSSVITAAIKAASITNDMIASAAAIALSKLAALSNHNRALVSDNTGLISESAVTATELSYLANATSEIQAQLNGKQASGSYEVTTNKVTSFQATPDDFHFCSEKLIKDSLDGKQASGSYEVTTNKDTATDLGGASTSDTKYPSQKAVKTYADTLVSAGASFTDSITAHAGGGQANAVELTTVDNIVTTCATSLDSTKLPATFAVNTRRRIVNNGSKICALYPASGDSIDSLSANAYIAILPGCTVELVATTADSAWKIITGKIQETPQLDLTSVVTFASGPGSLDSVGRCVGVIRKDFNGALRFIFNLKYSANAQTRTTFGVNIVGVIFKNVSAYYQQCVGHNVSGSTFFSTYTVPNTAEVRTEHSNISTTNYWVSGDVELESQTLI